MRFLQAAPFQTGIKTIFFSQTLTRINRKRQYSKNKLQISSNFLKFKYQTSSLTRRSSDNFDIGIYLIFDHL